MGATFASPGATDLLTAWERGLHQAPVERALTMLGTAKPGLAFNDLAKLPVGTRDADLFRLRSRIFGSRMVALATCPACQEPVELSIDIPAVLEVAREGVAVDSPMQVKVDGYKVVFRNPTTADLAELGGVESLEDARQHLLERCLVSVERDGQPITGRDLPPVVIGQIIATMSERDPLADVSLASVCPICDHEWEAPLDIAEFLWTELNAWARRTLREIHILASGYGWRESDILALSPLRRHAYLELLQDE